MAGYAGMVMVLNMIVQYLLLAGTNRLHHTAGQWLNMLLGGAVGGLYAGICLLPKCSFLASGISRFIMLVVIGILAFGVTVAALRRTAVFVLLNMAFEGIVAGFGVDNFWYCAVAIGLLGILCALGFRGDKVNGTYIPMEISYAGRKICVTALRDTGNMLTDPITGQQVFVVDPSVACQITGLTQQQLRMPLEAIVSAKMPGLRLIPYRTVGQDNAFLLALRMQVKMGDKSGLYLVAFAPEVFGKGSAYQALAGGFV